MSALVRWRAAAVRTGLIISLALQVIGCTSQEQRAQSYYGNGMKFLAAKEDEKAAVEFRNALSLKRDWLPALRGLAQADRAVSRLPDLVAVLQAILRRDPKDLASRIELAKILLAGGAVDQALKVVNEGGNSSTNNASLLAVKAMIFLRLKDSENAVGAAQAALKSDPGNLDALKVLASDRLEKHDPNSALQLLSGVALDQNADLGIQLIKIKIYEELGNFGHVESLLRALVQRHPEESAFRRQLIKFYLDSNRPGQAESELRALIAADPKNSEAELDLVRLLSAIKGPAAGRAELASRIKTGGDVFRYKLALAELDYAQGDYNSSFNLLKALSSGESSPDNALAAKIELAQLYIDRGNLTDADALVAEVLRDDSVSALKRHTDALKLRATIRIDRGQLQLAIFDLREALQSRPRSAELLLLLATAYERGGAIDLADEQFVEALKDSNNAPEVGLSYAAFLNRRGNIGRADDILTTLASEYPKDLRILTALAEIKLLRQDWTGAQKISDEIHRLGKLNGLADQILGEALVGERKYDAGISAFQDAMAGAPTALQPMVSLVQTLVRAKETDRAESFLRTLLKSDPANADAYVLLGSIQLAKDRSDEAMKTFMMAIEKQPKNSIGYRAVADLYLEQKNTVAAQMIIRSGLTQNQDSLALQMALAGIFEKMSNYEAAISEYEHLLTQQPGSMIIVNNLASLLADHRTDKASLERAQSLAAELTQSQVPQFKDTLGWVSYRRGDFKTAVQLLQEAAAALSDPLVHYHLGMSYVATGQIGKAAKEFNIALAKAPDSALEKAAENELSQIAKKSTGNARGAISEP